MGVGENLGLRLRFVLLKPRAENVLVTKSTATLIKRCLARAPFRGYCSCSSFTPSPPILTLACQAARHDASTP